jgi:hypothetical protein
MSVARLGLTLLAGLFAVTPQVSAQIGLREGARVRLDADGSPRIAGVVQ